MPERSGASAAVRTEDADGGPADARRVTDERSPLRWLAFLAGITLVVAVLYVGRGVLIPLAIAVLLTFLLSPIVTRFQRLGLPRVPAVLVTTLAAFVLIGALALLIGAQATQLATDLPTYQSNLITKLRDLREAAPSGGVIERFSSMVTTLRAEVEGPAEEAPAEAPEVPVVQVQQPPPSAFGVIADVAAPLIGPVGKSGIVVVLVIFMLLEREDLRNRLIRLIGPNINVTTEALDEAGYRVSRYLLMQLVVNLTYGIPLGVGLYFIGIPNAFLWAALAIVLRFIPYLGPLLSATFPLLLAVAVEPGWTTVLATLAWILTLEIISNNFIEPWLYGVSTSISAVAIIVAAIFWTTLWGPIGLLLSTPMTVCLAVAGRYFPQLAFLDVMLSSAPALSLPERLYQRLLAGDEDEAVAIAEEYLEEHELEQLYGQVVLPALRLAAADNARGTLSADRRLVVTRTSLELVGELADLDEGEQQAVEKEPLPLAVEPRTSVLCAAGSSGLDLPVAAMLGQLLERRGCTARVMSAEALAPRYLPASGVKDVDLVCLSYLEETALPRALHAARRLARHAPGKRLVIGLWGLPSGQESRLLERLPSDARVVDDLQEMLDAVAELVKPAAGDYQPAPVPDDEQERLADLRSLQALEAPDTLLERFTRRLTDAFGVPISLLNLVDEDSQRFKGQVGLPEDLARAGASPRDTSICGHVVAENDLLVIEDALKDPRFAKNPFLLEHGIRFYAGVPLRSRRGHAVGSLCVIDATPRAVTEEEKILLRSVGAEAMEALEAAVGAPGQPTPEPPLRDAEILR